MTMHLVSPATSSFRSMPVRLGVLALAVVFTASQTPAQGPIPRSADEAQPAATAQSRQAATPVPATAVQASHITETSALPEAPNTPEEQASVVRPLDIKAIMDDAAQNTQNLQPTASTTASKHQIHPGWLALSAVGALGATIGAMGLSKGSTKGKPVAAGFIGVGAGLTGLGLYLTFK